MAQGNRLKQIASRGLLAAFCSLVLCLLHGNDLVAQSILDKQSPHNQSTTDGLPEPQNGYSSDKWAPSDVGASVQPLDPTQRCSLADVLDRTGHNVELMIHNFDRFAATESVEHQKIDRNGKLGKAERKTFDYVASVIPQESGYTLIDEARGDGTAVATFPEGIATIGTSTLALIMLPAYAPDFQMQCDGLGQWQGKSAWQVRFEQRTDRVNHLSGFRVDRDFYYTRLRGRIWIDTHSYQIAHIEADLADSIPKIGLKLEHMEVDYGVVDFAQSGTELWLPLSAELHLDFRNHRFYRHHVFTNFQLFSVRVNQRFMSKRPN
jgi:hypothetical protein